MSEIQWKNPPKPGPRKVDVVASQLRSKPGEWALVGRAPAGIQFLPWYTPLHNDDDYEVKFVRVDPNSGPFGERDIYARYIKIPLPPLGQASVSNTVEAPPLEAALEMIRRRGGATFEVKGGGLHEIRGLLDRADQLCVSVDDVLLLSQITRLVGR